MRYPQSFLDEIRARLPVSEVVRRKVALKKAGREWKGLSPFNPEKSPSFFVNDQKGFYHCFSSGKHGDQFRFLMETEGLSFREAVERLANLAGLAVPAASPEDEKREARRKTLHEVMELAAKFFEDSLQARAGARARGYLADRAIAPATQARFRLGYSPGPRDEVPGGRFALKEHLGGKSVPVEDMVEAGLLVSGEDIPLPFDRFRERVMFPITDFKNRVVGFGARALADDAQPKYLNSPETPLFHKGALLYNVAGARAAAHKGASPIAVEGYVDVIALVAAGFEAAVAPLGTALTEDQLLLLWRMGQEPILCFDGDQAGRRAAYRAVDLALPLLKPGISLRFALLPEGQDPDDLVRQAGPEAMQEVLKAAQPLSSMLWQRETEAANLETPERKAALEARLSDLLRMIQDETVRRHYRDELAQRLRRLFAPADGGPARSNFRDSPGRRRTFAPRGQLRERGARLAASPMVRGALAAVPAREALILVAVLNHPWLLADHAEALAELEFAHRDAEALRRALLDAAAGGAADTETLAHRVEEVGAGPALASIKRAITHAADWPVRPDAAPEDVARFWRQVATLQVKKRTLSKELREAERALGAEPSEANFARLKDVQNRLAALDGTEALIEGFGEPSGRPARTM